jgi:hypothetical protein
MATRQSARARGPDRVDSPSVVHRIRDHASALANALQLVRMTAGDDLRLANALDLADRQAKALVALADELHDPA